MKWLAWIIGGIAVGGATAALWPRETRRVVDAMERTGLDQALGAVAIATAPAGAPRNVLKALSG